MTRRGIVALGAIVVIAAFATMVDLPGSNRLIRSLQNAGHAVAFGAIALLLVSILKAESGRHKFSPAGIYLMAAGLAAFLASFTEALQFVIGRDAEWGDLLRDVLGALAGLTVYATLPIAGDLQLLGKSAKAKLVFRILGLLIFLCTQVAFLETLAAYLQRNHVFPRLIDFDARWSRTFVDLQCTGSLAAAPPDWGPSARGRVLQLTLEGADYPGVQIEEPYADWRGYREFCLDIYLKQPDSVELGLRVDDSHHNFAPSDRFDRRITVVSGAQTVRIPLDSVRVGPANRLLDLGSIARIIVFAHNPRDTVIVLLDRVWLE